MSRRARGVHLEQGRTLVVERLQHALAEVNGLGNRRLCDKSVALCQGKQAEISARVVATCAATSEVERAENQNLDRETGIQQPDQLAQPLSGEHLVTADQHEGRADCQFLFAQILPVQARECVALPVGTVGLVDFNVRQTQQTNQIGGLVQVPLDQSRGELRRVASHINEGRYLERIVRKRSSPGGGAAARDGQTVTGAAEAMFTLNEAVVRRVDSVGKIDQAKEMVGVDGVVAGRVPDAFCQIFEIDAWARGAFQFLGHRIEVFYREGARERLVNQSRNRLARHSERFRKALHERLLMELGRGESQLDRHLFAGASFRVIATGQCKLAIARQQDCRHRADIRVLRNAFERLGRGVRRCRKYGPEFARLLERSRILLARSQCIGLAVVYTNAAGLAGLGIDHEGKQFGAVFLLRLGIKEKGFGDGNRQCAQCGADPVDTVLDCLLAFFGKRHLVVEPGVGVVKQLAERRRDLIGFLVTRDNARREF